MHGRGVRARADLVDAEVAAAPALRGAPQGGLAVSRGVHVRASAFSTAEIIGNSQAPLRPKRFANGQKHRESLNSFNSKI